MKKLSFVLAIIMLMSTFGIVGAIPASATSVLNGKSALFVGDSIMAGGRDDIEGVDPSEGLGWSYRIRKNYGMTVDNAAVSGQAMSTVRDAYMDPIYKQLEKKKGTHYDYVILQGGFNDIYGNEMSAAKETAPLGEISNSYDLEDFDRKTFASALEHLLCYATTYFPEAKIGFVITHETPYSRRGNGTNDRNTTKRYFDLAKQICDKWNMPYLNFYDGATADGTKYFDLFYPEGLSLVSRYPNGINSFDVLQRLKDDIHPNKEGYDVTYTHMAEWMATLPTYTAVSATDALRGKTAMFAGDSITYGFLDSVSAPRAWPYRLQKNYGMIVKNNAKSGYALSNVREAQGKLLHKCLEDNGTYDYVILHGGVNDAMDSAPIGIISETKDPTSFNVDTFAGGLERYFYEATTRFPNARIGFIINFATPSSTWGGRTKEPSAYWDMARDICDKWDIPYLDLYQDEYSIDILKANTTTYLGDTLHLNAAGYDVITPYIAEWMATLEPYNDETVSTSTLMWENDFDDITAPWYNELWGASDKGNFNSGTVGRTDVTAGNFAVYEQGADGNGYMKLGFDTWNSRKFLSGFHVRHQAATLKGVTDVYGCGGAAEAWTDGGAFAPTAGQYTIAFDYKLANLVDDASTVLDICVGFANAATFFWDGARNLATFTNSTNEGVVYTAASVKLSNLGADWAHATLTVEIKGNTDRSMHIFLSNRNDGSNPCGAVLVDNFTMSLNASEDTHEHEYDNACDPDCNDCGEEREVTHDFEWVNDIPASCGANGWEHEECTVCHETRNMNTPIDATGEHEYDNACDANCNVCGYEREVAGHIYDNDRDPDCNECGDIREIAPLNGWVEDDGKWYFYENDVMIKNAWRKDSVGWVFLGEDGAMLTNAWCTDTQGWCYVGADGYAVTNCWKKDSVGWIWLNANGSMTKSAWVKDGGKWYCLNASGYMVANDWVQDGGKWYFLGADGAMLTNAWKKDSVGWVYLGANGAMLTNSWCKDSVGWCYVGADGYAVTNCWKKDSKGWCYLDANGRMVTNTTVRDSKGLCYIDANGYWDGQYR